MSINDFIELHFLIHISLAFVLIIVSLIIVLVILRRKRVVRTKQADRLFKKHKDLIKRLSDDKADSSDDIVKRLKEIGNKKDIEIILDRAVELLGHPLSHFRTLYDAAGITDRYLDIVKNSNSWKQRAIAAEKLGHIGSVRSVSQLLSVVRDTKDEDEDVRAIALRALGRIKDNRAIPFLIEALGYPETWLPPRIGEILVSIGDDSTKHLIKGLKDYKSDASRGWAAEILGWLDAKSAVPQLIDALFDVSPEVRAKAAGALGKIKDDRAVSKLTELLLSDPVPFVRVRIANALGNIGHPAVIDNLINVLKDPEWWVRMRAVEALEQLGEKAISGLLIALEENDVEVCKRAAMALERIGYVERILDEYGKHKYKPEIKHVLFLVARAGVIESMSDKLTTSQVNLVKNIVRIFGEAGTKEASEPMLELLSHTSDWTLKARIIEALGKIGVQEAIPHLINYIKDNEYWVRKSSVDALGMLNARDYVDDIASILDDPNPMARESSLIALSGLKVSCHQEKIEKLLMDPSSKVRSTALTALRKLELTAERESVIGLLRDAAEEVRIEGIRYFAARENSKILDDIIQLLAHGSEAVRHEVVEYVRKVKPAHFQKILHRFNIRELPTESISSLIEIASLVRDKDAYQFTVNMTGCSDPLLRAVALDALIKFGLKGNEKFFEKGLFDPSEAVRVTAIACIASGPGKKLLEKAKPLSKDPDESVRVAFALALGASGFAECKTFATEMLDDPSESVVAGALVSLASFDDPILMEVFNSRKEIKQIRGAISVIKENPRFGAIVDTIRSRALETNNLAVKLLLAHDNRKFTDDLLTLLKESLNPTLRVEAMAMLRLIDISEFFTAILGIMKKDPSAEVRIRAMEAVITVERDDEIISALSSMLFDPVPSVRYRAAELLGQYKQPMAIEALTHALDSSDRQFREIVTTSLSQLLSEKPGKVNELVKSVPETRTRKLGMAWLMGKSRKRGALKYLLNLLDDVDPDVRASALGGIGKFRRKQLLNNDDQLLFDTFMKRLEKCIYDPNERVRAAVVNTITAIGGDRAFGIVASALEDSDEFVRRRVAIGLAQLDAKHSIELLSEKAEQLPDMRSYMRGISYAAGVSYDKTVKHDELATSIVNELCSKEKMYIHFTSSPDKNMRVHAFRVLTLISSDTAETLKSIAMNDPSPEVRDEAARYFKG